MSKEDENTFSLFCEVSTCMGIFDWYREKNLCGKSFWAIIVVSGLIITSVQTYVTFAQHLNEARYQTTISTEYWNEGIPAPYIVICNYNRAKRSLINQTKIDPKIFTYIYELFPTTYDIGLHFLGTKGLSEYQNAWADYVKKGGESDIQKLMHFYGHNYSDTFINVYTEGTLNSTIEFKEIFTVYGRCWKGKPMTKLEIGTVLT